MDENKVIENENEEAAYCTLVDEDGNEIQFEVIGSAELKGTTYYAMIPADADQDAEEIEFVILKSIIDENGEENLVTVDDEDEWDDVEDYFMDLFTEDIDYDA
jgi:uncharacterized protein YrzB (UPF0473 family)